MMFVTLKIRSSRGAFPLDETDINPRAVTRLKGYTETYSDGSPPKDWTSIYFGENDRVVAEGNIKDIKEKFSEALRT